MAIIKYQLVDGTIPPELDDGGYFPVGDYFIGIGSGVGTELSKSELLEYILADHRINPFNYKFNVGTTEVLGVDASDSNGVVQLSPNKTTAEVTDEVNDWCRLMGIS